MLQHVTWNLKLPRSFYRKSEKMKEWNADARTICDILRASAAFTSPVKLKEAVEYLKEKEKKGLIKIRTTSSTTSRIYVMATWTYACKLHSPATQ